MKRLITTLFILVSLVLTTQVVRHVHLLAFGSKVSVLEQFEPKSDEDTEIKKEVSTEILLKEYGELKPRANALVKGSDWSAQQEARQQDPDLFARCDLLEREIMQREARMDDLRDLWLFSGAGMLLIVAGILLVRRGGAWVSLSFIVAGFCELLWWSKPDFFGGGAFREYGFLLQSKLIISLVALASLYGLWSLREALTKNLNSQ